jgi:uncharacterized protein (PEP-CTERM system associated)
VTHARRWPALGVAAGLLLAWAPAEDAGAQAPNWRFKPYVTVRETLTDNVNLLPPGEEQNDLITEITPGVRIDGRGPRVEASGTLSVRTLTYAETGDRNNLVYPQANLRGKVEALRDFLFVEGQATVIQTFVSPLGGTSLDDTASNRNRYTAEYYRLSPYIEGDLAGGRLSYRLRNDNIWTSSSNTSSVSLANSYSNNIIGLLESEVQPLGWAADVERSETSFADQDDSFLVELARLRLRYQLGPDWRLTASGGYERRQFPLDDSKGAIYGAGVEWRPGPRTQGTARWEERVFGPSYFASLDHRRAWSAVRMLASRNVVTYPQLIGALSGPNGLESLLGAAFFARFPDPVERQAAIDSFIRQNALPGNLATTTPFFTQQVLLQETQSATFTVIGGRNTVAVTVFHQRNQPIAGGSGTELPPELSFSNDNDQTGGSFTWSRRLSSRTSVNALTSYTNIETFLPNGRTDDAKLYLVRILLNHEIGAKTNGFAGVRAQRRDATITTDYREMAVYVGLTHQF